MTGNIGSSAGVDNRAAYTSVGDNYCDEKDAEEASNGRTDLFLAFEVESWDLLRKEIIFIFGILILQHLFI